MSSPRSRLNLGSATPFVPIALITLIGAILRLTQIDQSLYGDELWTYVDATNPGLGGVLDFVNSDQEITPPLYPILAWFSAQLGDPTVLVRIPSVAAGIATIPLVYAIATRTLGRGVALVAATLAALSPFLAFYAVEARAYALAIALLLASTLCMLIALQTGRTRWWAGYAFFTCAAMYTHYTCAYILLPQLGWLLWVHRDVWRQALGANVIAALAYLPWLPGVIDDFRSPSQDAINALAPFNFDNAVNFTTRWALGHPTNGLFKFWGAALEAVLIVGFVVAVAGLLLNRRRSSASAPEDASARRQALALFVTLALAAPVAVAFVSLVGNDQYIPRNLGVSTPFLLIAFAALLMAGPKPLRIAVTSLVLVAFTFGAVRTIEADWRRPDIEGAARFIDEATGPDDVVLDVVSPFIDPTMPPALTLDIQLEDPHVMAEGAIPGEAQDRLAGATGHKYVIVGRPEVVETIAENLGLTGPPAEERTFTGGLPTTVRIYDITEPPPAGPAS